MTSTTWTLKEAGEALGVGRETLRKAILAGDLPALPVAGPGGKTYKVAPDEARAWQNRRMAAVGDLGAMGAHAVGARGAELGIMGDLGAPSGDLGAMGTILGAVGDPMATVGTIHLGSRGTMGARLGAVGDSVGAKELPIAPRSPRAATMGDLGDTEVGAVGAVATPQPSESAGSVPVAVHLRTLDLLEAAHASADRERAGRELAERQLLALRFELTNYQRALGESAESLAEERAKRLTAELGSQIIQHAEPSSVTEVFQQVAPAQSALDIASAHPTCQPDPAIRPKEGWTRRFRRWFLGKKTD